RIILSAHCTAAAISASVYGLLCGPPNRSSAVFKCLATRIPATIANTRFRPSSTHTGYTFRLLFAYGSKVCLRPHCVVDSRVWSDRKPWCPRFASAFGTLTWGFTVLGSVTGVSLTQVPDTVQSRLLPDRGTARRSRAHLRRWAAQYASHWRGPGQPSRP